MTIEDISQAAEFIPQTVKSSIIKVIGVGGGGNNAVQHMYNQNIENVSFWVCNTDDQALKNSSVPNKLLIGETGLGAGNVPSVARQAALDSEESIADLFTDNTKMVFITAGMGGGTGTGAAPVVARIAREHGMLTIGIVTIPFLFEGQKKILKALEGAEEMSKYVDALLVINNERLTEIYPELNFINAFGKADDTLTIAARGISEMITNSNTVINIDFNDVDTTLRNGGAAVISIGYGEGEHRVTKAINDALNSPLLKDRDIFGSQRLLFNIYFNPDGDQEFLMKEASEISEFVSDINPNVDIIWGLAKDSSLGNKVKITILAAGFATRNDNNEKNSPEKKTVNAGSVNESGPVILEEPIEKPTDTAKRLVDLYGKGKTETIVRSPEAQKYIILTPDQINDDSIIEKFENMPTSSRDRRVVEEIKKAHKKPATADNDTLTDTEGTSSHSDIPTGSTRIVF
ncbi:MAG: cell division protein FtsZ [Muribaculaceae bacterium]|nr:cell division protein FtsZ [Muribaculaceae bacterium]